MNKKIFSLIMCLVALTNPLLAADNLTISNFLVVQGVEGQEFAIELNNDQNYAAFQFDLVLPEGITLTGYSAASRLATDTDVQVQQQPNGSYRFIAIPPNLTTNITGTSGAIITITISASADVALGSLTGYFRNVKLSKTNGEGKTYNEMSFSVNTLRLGDVNGDNSVDAQDASLVLQHVAGKKPLSGPFLIAADVNDDHGVDAQDASLILQYVAGKISW